MSQSGSPVHFSTSKTLITVVLVQLSLSELQSVSFRQIYFSLERKLFTTQEAWLHMAWGVLVNTDEY